MNARHDPEAVGTVRGKLAAAGDDTLVTLSGGGARVTGTLADLERAASSIATGVDGAAAGQLRALVERIERLAEEKQAIADDIRDVYGEAKAHGFDTKVLRKVIALRRQDASEREEQEAILDLYKHALGMV